FVLSLYNFNPLTSGSDDVCVIIHRLSLHTRKVIFPEIRSIEQHLKGLRFIRIQTKIEIRSIVSDVDIIRFVFHKTSEICKSSIDNLKSGWYNLSKRHILNLLIRRIANG